MRMSKKTKRLKTMFPEKDESYLSDVRRNNITLNDTIDDIFGVEALEGWFYFTKKVNVLIRYLLEPWSWYSQSSCRYLFFRLGYTLCNVK